MYITASSLLSWLMGVFYRADFTQSRPPVFYTVKGENIILEKHLVKQIYPTNISLAKILQCYEQIYCDL